MKKIYLTKEKKSYLQENKHRHYVHEGSVKLETFNGWTYMVTR